MSDHPFAYNKVQVRECASEALRRRQRKKSTTTTTTRTLESDQSFSSTTPISSEDNERISQQQQQEQHDELINLVSLPSCQEFYQRYLSHYTYKIELYKTLPPNLKPFYKNMVQEYYKAVGK